MDYEKAYKEALERARKIAQLYEPLQLALNNVFIEINLK